MLEAVLAITVRTAHAGVFECINERFTRQMRALLGIVDVGLFCRGAVFFLVCGAVAPARPFARVGAFVGSFGAVIEAEGASAGFAAEGEEVELAAVFELAVAAD